MAKSYATLIRIEDIKAQIHKNLSTIPMSSREYSKAYGLDYACTRRYFSDLLKRNLIKLAFNKPHAVGGVQVPYYKSWNKFKRIDYSERYATYLAKKNGTFKKPKKEVKEPALVKQGHVLIDPKNPHIKTYLNMSRPGTDYTWQRKKKASSVNIGSSFSMMEGL